MPAETIEVNAHALIRVMMRRSIDDVWRGGADPESKPQLLSSRAFLESSRAQQVPQSALRLIHRILALARIA